MIYTYNLCYSNYNISDDTFNKIKNKIETVRPDAPQDISFGPRNTIFLAEKPGSEHYNLNEFVLCNKTKSFYAIASIRNDENYTNQWLILKNPDNSHKRILFNRTESADTTLYRRMTVEEIKKYFNDDN
jgi:hypothetical protein